MITKEFLQSQLRDSETWEPIYCQIVNLLESNDRIRLSEVSEIADKTENSVEDVFLVLQLLTVSPEPIRMVYRKFEDGKSKEDFIKYIDRLVAHYGAFQYDFRWTQRIKW